MLSPFSLFDRIITWYTEKLSKKARTIITVIAGLFLLGGAVTGYKVNDYFENDPNACQMCHVHDHAQESWKTSVHSKVTCHDCHHATRKDQVMQVYNFVFLGHKTVSPRHGEIIVPKKFCMKCHWEKDADNEKYQKKYPQAPKVFQSQYHLRHATTAGLECTQCHGYVTHKFPTDERFCVKCHVGKEVHGTGMEKLACLNCHTERTKNLRPGRKKCLYCHGEESVRQELVKDGNIDVKHFQPPQETVDKAIKITISDESPMQYHCYECHHPHRQNRPDWKDCIKCHSNIPSTGRHLIHIQTAGMGCKDCHRPHRWTVTAEAAKKQCGKCHEYRDPNTFLAL